MMPRRRLKEERGFTLVEALVTITVATLVAFGLILSSFTSIKSTAQTEQGLDVTDIMDSEFASLMSRASTLSLPLHETEEIKKREAVFTVTRNITQDPDHPYCAKAEVVISWKQGQVLVPQTRRQISLLPLPKSAAKETP